MRTVEKVGRTTDDAITEAIIELGVTRDQVDVEIIDKGSKGFLLGIGSKDARVRVTVKEMFDKDEDEFFIPVKKEEKEEAKPATKSAATLSNQNKKDDYDTSNVTSDELVHIEQEAKRFLAKLIEEMGVQGTIDTRIANNRIYMSISGDGMGIIIGKRGETLDAVQYMVNIVANKGREEYVKIVVDTENYRERREETLKNLAHRLAKKASQTRRPVVLEPMNPYDRRIIHSALQESKTVKTHSEGKEPFRKVVISPMNHRSHK